MAAQDEKAKSVSELLADCANYAELKDLNAALKAVNAAVRLSKGEDDTHLMTVLDRRVAIHLEMGNKGTAFRGAKSMIHHEPKDGRGYFWCSSIAQKQNNLSLAISLLDQGLEYVPNSDSCHQLLLQQVADVRGQRRHQLASNVKDPLTVLPIEIVELVLSRIRYRQLIQMLQLSKVWKKVLLSVRPLIDTLKFPSQGTASRGMSITPRMLNAALERFKLRKKVIVRGLPPSSGRLLASAFQRSDFNTIEYMDVSGSWSNSWFQPRLVPQALNLPMLNLKTIVVDSLAPISWVCNVIRDCPNLRTAIFENVQQGNSSGLSLNNRNLQTVLLSMYRISDDEEDRDQIMAHGQSIVTEFFFDHVPQLQALTCAGFACQPLDKTMDLGHLRHLRRLRFKSSVLPNLRLPSGLQTIHFEYCHFPQEVSYQDNYDVCSPLDNLSGLYLGGGDIPPWCIQQAAMATKPGTLEKFRFQYDKGTSPKFETMIEHAWFKGVKDFEIFGPNLDDSLALLFAKCFPKLEKLTLAVAGGVTEVFVSNIIKAQMPNLRSIDIAEADGMDEDIVSWADARGVAVKLRKY